jgi:putative oxidoreductase
MNTQLDQASLGLRIALGVLFIAHSLLKILVFTVPGTVAFFASIGLPGVLAYPVIAGELLGGVALIAGVYVRPVAALLALISFGAILAHAGNGWVFSAPGGGWEYPLFLGVVCLVQATLGGGRYALQRSA